MRELIDYIGSLELTGGDGVRAPGAYPPPRGDLGAMVATVGDAPGRIGSPSALIAHHALTRVHA